MKLIYWILTSILFLSSFYSEATEYYLNSDSGNDSNSGTSSTAPWKSLEMLMAKKLEPGDVVNFARGSVWTKAAWECILLIDDSGSENAPITFRAYGNGEKPLFSNGGQVWNKGIKITGNYNILENLHVKDTGYGGFEIEKESAHNIIRDCEVSNCGMGILCYGSDNLFTRNYIHNLKMIIDNEIPDTQSGGGDFGCVSFWLYGPNNEISYNRCIDNIGHSYDYITDGGFIEFYENPDGTYAHHNWVENGNGIAESSNGSGKNIIIAYNVFIESGGLFAFHTDNFTLESFRFENNTVITQKGTLWNNMFNFYPNNKITYEIIIQNNIFVLGGDAEEQVSKNNNFRHTNNIYYLLDGAGLGSLILDESEMIADPKFVNLKNHDFRLQPGSPAIDVGANLGYQVDFMNNEIPEGNGPDIGAYEYEKAKH